MKKKKNSFKEIRERETDRRVRGNTVIDCEKKRKKKKTPYEE